MYKPSLVAELLWSLLSIVALAVLFGFLAGIGLYVLL